MISGRSARWLRTENGQAIVLMAIMMTAILMILGLAIDGGRLFVERRTMQEAADAGAFGGAVVLYQTTNVANATAQAVVDVTKNGYTTGGNVTVTVNSPPTSGTYSGNANYLEVIITNTGRTIFLPSSVTTITVRGVGGTESFGGGSSSYALMALATSGGSTLEIDSGSNTNITGTSLGIAVNSNDNQGANNSGSTITLAPATAKTKVVGSGANGTWPSLLTNQTPAADPYAGFAKPSTSGLPTCSSLTSPGCRDGSGHQNPGVYTTDLTGQSFILNAGNYIMKGTNISLTSSGQSLTGTGVFIFMTSSSYPSTGSSCGQIQLEGGVNISAPTSGTYNGMLIYMDANCSSQLHMDSGSSGTLVGTIYMPKAYVEIEPSGTTTVTQLIASTMRIRSPLTVNYDATKVAGAAGGIPALTE